MTFDINKLKKRCNMPIEHFMGMGKVTRNKAGDRHIFIDRGAKVLAVAHLDTVQSGKSFSYTRKAVYSPRLDDRLGVYTVLDLLPRMGVLCDVLLTENEEHGNSTAQDFVATKDYNWIFEFDRSGNDVVMYEYEDDDMVGLIETYGFEVGYGSYTDICELEDLGVKGFNFPVAYYNYHASNAYALLDDYKASVNKFLNFYDAMKDVKLPHTKVARRSYTTYRYDWSEDYYTPKDYKAYNGVKYKNDDTVSINGKHIPSACPTCGVQWINDIKHHYWNSTTNSVTCKAKPKTGECYYCGNALTEHDDAAMAEYGICQMCVDYQSKYGWLK